MVLAIASTFFFLLLQKSATRECVQLCAALEYLPSVDQTVAAVGHRDPDDRAGSKGRTRTPPAARPRAHAWTHACTQIAEACHRTGRAKSLKLGMQEAYNDDQCEAAVCARLDAVGPPLPLAISPLLCSPRDEEEQPCNSVSAAWSP